MIWSILFATGALAWLGFVVASMPMHAYRRGRRVRTRKPDRDGLWWFGSGNIPSLAYISAWPAQYRYRGAHRREEGT